jgi:hypothetical protein
MYRTAILITIGIFSVGTAAAQSEKDIQPAPQAQEATALLPIGAPISATLTKSIDSKKAKKGDPVSARATESTKQNGKTLIPSGARLEGHVTQASARAKGDSFSTLGIVFDKAILKEGEQIPLNVTVQALASAPGAVASNGTGMEMAPMGGTSSFPTSAGRMGTNASAAPPANPATTTTDTVANTDTNNAASGKGAVGGLTADGRLTFDSHGVFGLQGVGLAAPSDSQPATVITSTDKYVHLESGTQLLLVTQATTSAAAKP